MKSLFRIALLLVLCLVGWYGWRVVQRGDYSSDGLQSVYQETSNDLKQRASHVKQKFDSLDVGDTFERVGGTLSNFGGEISEKFEATDWNELKNKVGMSDQELKEYWNGLEWVYTEEEKRSDPAMAPGEPAPGMESSNPESQKLKSTAPGTAPKTEPAGSKTVNPAPTEKTAPKPVAITPASYTKGMTLLAEAKEHSRKALPGMSQHLMHLKKSAILYEKGRSELQKALQDKNLDASKRNEIDSVLPKINKQIYWANKMGTL